MSDLEYRIHQAINRVRMHNGLRELVWHENLAEIARDHSRNMASRKFFAHKDPIEGELTQRVQKRARYHWITYGENLYLSAGLSDPVTGAVKGWMNSPSHRSNILNRNFRQAGVGVARSWRGELYFTQVFGTMG